MIQVVLASNNKKKIKELETLLAFGSSNKQVVDVLSLKDIAFEDDIVEDGRYRFCAYNLSLHRNRFVCIDGRTCIFALL